MTMIWPVSAPVGASADGTVLIEEFSVSEENARYHNARASGYSMILPGTYKRLLIKGRFGHELVMSNTPLEQKTNREFVDNATGKILINGLGLGMIVEQLLLKPDTEHITVVEVNKSVIELVGPMFKDNPRVTIVNACAFTYVPPKGVRYDYVWHDIWTDITPENIPSMTRLIRKYGKRTKWQGCWAKDLCILAAKGHRI